MRHRIQWIAIASLAAAAMAVGAADRRPVGGLSAPSKTQAPMDRRAVDQSANDGMVAARVARLRHARDVLRKLAASPLPRNLSPAERLEAGRYNKWLIDAAGRLDALARRGQMLRRPGAASTSAEAQRRMQEMNMSFNLQYLQLQQNMQMENRQFTLMSNIMKVKHDTARNAINNVR